MTSEVFRSLQTIKEMLVDRGFSSAYIDGVIDKYQPGELGAIINAKSIFSILLKELNIMIIYVLSSRQRNNDINAHIQSLDEPFDGTYILVVKEKFNTADQKKLNALGDVQVFLLSELQYNVSKHELVPKHILIKDEAEIARIVESYQLKSRNQLPWILKTDAMARYLSAKPGNVVKIVRIASSCGENVVYRCCV